MSETEAPKEIIVADDDPDILDVVSSVLEVSGYNVRRACNGSQAKAYLDQKLPDLAIFDLTMPGYDGNQLCSMVRQMPGGEAVSILILTARDAIDDRVNALEGGADEYVTKPFNHSELLARVRALLRIRALNVSLTEKNTELQRMQHKLVEHERALAITQITGSAAHNLGQPLSAIMLNTALLAQLSSADERFKSALAAIKQDAKKMGELLEKLRTTEGKKTANYFRGESIVDLS